MPRTPKPFIYGEEPRKESPVFARMRCRADENVGPKPNARRAILHREKRYVLCLKKSASAHAARADSGVSDTAR